MSDDDKDLLTRVLFGFLESDFAATLVVAPSHPSFRLLDVQGFFDAFEADPEVTLEWTAVQSRRSGTFYTFHAQRRKGG